MPHAIVMPQLGMTMTEGSVLRWLKQPGDRIEKGEPLFEVQTDKVDMEVESTATGFVFEFLVEPGKNVPVGATIARITERPEDAQAISEKKLASPRARRLARELELDIALVDPSVGSARIVEKDVLRYAERRRPEQTEATAVAVQPQQSDEQPAEVSPARKVIAARVTESFQTIPHFYLTVLADATGLEQMRRQLLQPIERRSGARLSYTDLFIKALALALRENPRANAAWQDGRIVTRPEVNIGFAAQINNVLLVPVIRRADELPLAEIARSRSDLVQKARSGELRVADMEEGSCTLSNLGPFGVDQFQAIINPRQSAILATGRIAQRPVVDNGQIVARLSVSLTLSVDHRVIDGVAAAAFLRSIMNALESPYTLLLNGG